MDLNELRAEHRAVGIGPLILHEVREVVSSVVWSYDPTIYGEVWDWDDGVEDLVQEFCLEVLIEQGQLDYAMLVAADHLHFRRLLARQVRHHLAKRRRRTIVDNLLDRCKEIVSSKPFEIGIHGRGWSFTLAGKKVDPGSVRPSDLAETIGRLAAVPQIRRNPATRASMVYSTKKLEELLKTVADSLPCRVTVGDLHIVFSNLLTSWLPSFLLKSEGGMDRAEVTMLNAEDTALVNEAVQRIYSKCTDDQLELLGFKLSGTPDVTIAAHYGVSRPTVLKKKRQLLEILRNSLANLPDSARVEAMSRLESRLAEKASSSDAE
jgi:hypothetical protein